ncbi:MAG TPA: Mov34/MPN/PAD-1 family protein [Pirellulaceae bacterium]|jgi:proteasome lid subunit RPN8/RPN11|nr:Mov34/MPN/PAD-1 family protein [Pirellulaceae bacterium]
MVVTPGERPAEAKPAPGGPDLDSADRSKWPVREPALQLAESAPSVPVVVRRPALEAMYAHGQENREIEICGVLVGGGYVTPEGRPYLHVVGAIRGEHAGSQVAQVTFTAETWQHIHTTMDRDWPEERIIGWYHTHPNFGIFLSEMDLFIHTSFFGAPDQLAFVYDAIREEEGLFVWRNGATERTAFLIEPNRSSSAGSVAAAATDEGGITYLSEAPNPDVARLVRELEALRRWKRLSLLAILALLFVSFILAVMQLSGGGQDSDDASPRTPSARVKGDDR